MVSSSRCLQAGELIEHAARFSALDVLAPAKG
jgi:hypothetical protein